MKITFLGTSHAVPEVGRRCPSTMMEINGKLYFIDAGAPIADLLRNRGADMTALRAVFATHMHGDHLGGLLNLADLINWYFRETDLQIYLTEQRGIDQFKALISTFSGPVDESRIHFRLMRPDFIYEDENIRVTPIPTRHMHKENRPTYAYLVEADGKKVLFTGDLSQHLEENDFPAYALEHPIDLLVMEMAHFSPAEAEPYLARCQARQVMIHHVSPVQEKFDGIQAMDGKFGYPIQAAKDDDELTL